MDVGSGRSNHRRPLLLKEFAAQGQNLFQAAGDSAKWTTTGKASQTYPADDVYVTSVGGTDLSTSSAAGAWASETAWANSGGGISPHEYANPNMADGRCSRVRQLFADLSQWSRCFRKRQLHLLRVRRSDSVHSKQLRRHQLCCTHVGRLHGSYQSAVGREWQRTAGLHQP